MNATDEHFGYTALIAAVGDDHADLVGPLVASGADLETRSTLGENALGVAALAGNADCVEALIRAGANVNVPLTPGGLPIARALAADPKYDQIRQLLVQAGAAAA